MTDEQHFSPEQFRRFIEGSGQPGEADAIKTHLQSGCQRCLSLTAEIAADLSAGLSSTRREMELVRRMLREEDLGEDLMEPTPGYDAAFDKALAFGIERVQDLMEERIRAAAQVAEIAKLSTAQKLVRLTNDRTFHTFGVFERLLAGAEELVFEDAVEASGLALAALKVAEKLEPEYYGRQDVKDFQAAALAAMGNCLRVSSDFVSAHECFTRAEQLLLEGTRDEYERASLLSLASSLEIDLGYFDDAYKTLDEARGIYAKKGDVHMAGRMILKQGLAVGYQNPPLGIKILHDSHEMIDPAKEPRLELCIRHTTAFFLAELGKGMEAFRVMQSSQWLYQQFSTRSIRARRLWLEGKINAALGYLAEAERILTRAGEDFLRLRLHQECVLVNIELAEIYFIEGRTEETIAVARAVCSRLHGWGMHSEGVALALLAVQSLVNRKASLGLFAELRSYMRRCWNRPEALENRE